MMPETIRDELLRRERIVFLDRAVDDAVASGAVAQLIWLEKQDASAEIRLYVSSPAGTPAAALAILDSLRALRCPVATYAIGHVTGGACLIASGGSPGRRFALPHSLFKLVRPKGRKTADPEALALETARLEEALYQAFSRTTGQSVREIERAHEAQESFDAARAKAYGLVDQVIEKSALPG